MTANYEITVKFNIIQDVENCTELIDMHELVQFITEELADRLVAQNAVVSVDFKGGKLDAK